MLQSCRRLRCSAWCETSCSISIAPAATHRKWVKQKTEQLRKKIPNQEVWLQNSAIQIYAVKEHTDFSSNTLAPRFKVKPTSFAEDRTHHIHLRSIWRLNPSQIQVVHVSHHSQPRRVLFENQSSKFPLIKPLEDAALLNSKPTSADSAHCLSHSSQWWFISFFSTTNTSLTPEKDHKLSPNKDLSLLSSTQRHTLVGLSEVRCFVFFPRKFGETHLPKPFFSFYPPGCEFISPSHSPQPCPIGSHCLPQVLREDASPGNFLQANGCKENLTQTLQNYNIGIPLC